MTTKAPPCNCRYCNVCAMFGIAHPLPKLAEGGPEISDQAPEEKPKARQPTLFDDGDGEDARETMGRE